MATTKICKENKRSDNSNRDSLGIGGLMLATNDGLEYDFASKDDAGDDMVRYIEINDGSTIDVLEFTPDEGTKENVAVALSDLPIIGELSGITLLPPVLKILVDTDTYEIVKGCYTKIKITGSYKAYGES